MFVYAPARMTRFPIAFTLAGLTLASFALVGCKLPKHGPLEEPATDLPARRPSPVSKSEDFAVDEDVSIIDDDDTFAIDGRVVTVTAAPKGYTVRMGTGRAAKTKAFPASRVFPAPWASAKRVRVGDSIYHVRQFGELTPPKCVVEVVPADIHASLIAKCDETGTRVVARTEAFFAIEPATATNLSPGDIAYYDRMSWVMIVGNVEPDGRSVAIRVSGYATTKDKLVPLSTLQRLR
jgi:hypothetical protein